MRRRLLAAALIVVAAVACVHPAEADQAQATIVSPNPVDWTPHVLDGTVWTMAAVGHVMVVGGWYLEDKEYEVSARRVMKVIESTTDPRSEYYSLMRRESVPADELMGRRMESGVLAVLGQLNATRNWMRIGREWWFADEPATELGREEWAYFEAKGERRTRKFSARIT